MSQESASTPSPGTTGGPKTNPDPLVFFQTILVNMTNRPEVDWNLVAKKVGYNTAETAKARFRQMKRKFNNGQSNTQPYSVPLKAQNSLSKVAKKNKTVKNRSPAIVTKSKPLPTRANTNEHEHGVKVKRGATKIKIEKAEVEDDADADGDTGSSFVDFGDVEYE